MNSQQEKRNNSHHHMKTHSITQVCTHYYARKVGKYAEQVIRPTKKYAAQNMRQLRITPVREEKTPTIRLQRYTPLKTCAN